jgi:hypothetical protein
MVGADESGALDGRIGKAGMSSTSASQAMP